MFREDVGAWSCFITWEGGGRERVRLCGVEKGLVGLLTSGVGRATGFGYDDANEQRPLQRDGYESLLAQ
jgi:hypothetical protein